MEIVIKISEERFRDIQRIAEVQLESNHFQTAEQVIANGIPLPKGHGRLIDQESVLDKIEEEIKDTLYVDSLIFGELIDFKNGKIDADDVIEEFNRVTRMEVLRIIDKYKTESEGEK